MNDIINFTTYEDCDIISAVLSGQTALYEIIIRRYNPYLFKIGRTYGFDFHDTEDLMQETFINAYRNLSKFENRSSFKTWLVKIMLNNCYHQKNKQKARSRVLVEEAVNPKIAIDNSIADTIMMNRELGHVLENALAKIPHDYRIVFSLRELNGLSTSETAESLGITESNVKVRLNRAKGMLRTEIQKMYSPEDIFEFNLIYCDRIVYNVMREITNE